MTCRSIELHLTVWHQVKFRDCLLISASMASKDTPKKLYKKVSTSTDSSSRCRLCYSVADPHYSKHLFGQSHQDLLRYAEFVFGGCLPHDSNLPHLICRPCERRLKNLAQFRSIVTETRRLLRKDVGTKRCIEVSPSIAKPTSKARVAGGSRRRSIDFGIDSNEQSALAVPLPVSLFYCSFLTVLTTFLLLHVLE